MRAVALVGALVTMCLGCDDRAQQADDAGSDEIDAGPPGPCWPDHAVEPNRPAELGTGRLAFEPMPADLPIEYGTQDGFNLVANVRMSGISPGNPLNVLDPVNPRTRIRAYFDETNVPLNFYAKCPYREGYEPSPGGGYELNQGLGITFEMCWRAQHLIGKRVRIEMEIQDTDGGFASSVQIVTLVPPADGGYYPTEIPQPGCEH